MPTYVNIGLGSAETLWGGGSAKMGGGQKLFDPSRGCQKFFHPSRGGVRIFLGVKMYDVEKIWTDLFKS